MNEVFRFLSENPILYFATIGLDNKPKVRPIQFMLEKDDKLFFCTGNKKAFYFEIEKSPYIELSVSAPDFSWIRLSAKVSFSNDIEVKKRIIDNSVLVRSIYRDASNPIFEIFYLEDIRATISDFSGNPPKEYVL